MIGASLTRIASSIVSGDTWLRSTSMPSQFISRTTSSPNLRKAAQRRLVGRRVGPRHVEAVGQRHVAGAERMHHAQRRQRVVDRMAAFHADHRGDPPALEHALDFCCRARQSQTSAASAAPCDGRCRSVRAWRAPPPCPASSRARRPTRTARRRRPAGGAGCRSCSFGTLPVMSALAKSRPDRGRAAPTDSRCGRR